MGSCGHLLPCRKEEGLDTFCHKSFDCLDINHLTVIAKLLTNSLLIVVLHIPDKHGKS